MNILYLRSYLSRLTFSFLGICNYPSYSIARPPRRHCCRQRARRSKKHMKHTTTTCRLFVDAACLVGRSLDDASCCSIPAHRRIVSFFQILLNCCADYSIFVDHYECSSCCRRLDDLPTSHEEKVGPRLTETMQLMMMLARKVAISLPLALVGDSKETAHSWSLRFSRYRAGHAT